MTRPVANPASLRHRLEIQVATDAKDAHGAPTQSWAAVATVWAGVEPLSGRELRDARQVEARVTHRITIRPYAGLTPKHRFVWGGRTFHILSLLNIEERGVLVEVLAEERVAA